MTEQWACGRCGGQSLAGSRFCSTCGQELGLTQPASGAGAPVGTPPPPLLPASHQPRWQVPTAIGPGSGTPWSGYGGPYGAGATGPAAARPFGVTMLAVTEVAIAVVGFFVAWGLAYWTSVDVDYDNAGSAVVDGGLGFAYVATAVWGLVIAQKLWSAQRSAWAGANLLSIVLLSLDVGSIILWGLTGLDLIGIVAHTSVLVYLNTAGVRALFGRPPLGLFGGQ